MQGKLVVLRPVMQEDSDAYFRWINNKDLVLKNSDYKPVSMLEHQNWFNTIALNPSTAIFSIVDSQTNKLIGSCSLRNINPNHKNAELQIRIGELDYHSRGFGSEAVNLLVNYGFSCLNLKRIYLHVFCNNLKAIKAYQKCLFNMEGILKKAAYINNDFIDVQIMAIINEADNYHSTY